MEANAVLSTEPPSLTPPVTSSELLDAGSLLAETKQTRKRKRACELAKDLSAVSPTRSDNTQPFNTFESQLNGRLGDVIERLALSQFRQGRGCISGWVTCPLCASVSQKRFALGRGIASHILTVHAPWSPGKAERKRRTRGWERQMRQTRHSSVLNGNLPPKISCTEPQEDIEAMEKLCKRWKPTQQEVDAWNAKVIKIISKLEQQFIVNVGASTYLSEDNAETVTFVAAGRDRTGSSVMTPYRGSLPAFLQASADGDLQLLQKMVQAARDNDQSNGISRLLDTKDRHLSTAEHWAAGSGHLNCLKFLVNTRHSCHTRMQDTLSESASNEYGSGISNTQNPKRTPRRRDGKTALHYAARNGHTHCIEYLLQELLCNVDEISGDGTTPLHLATFGGHIDAFDLLLTYGASVHRCNGWGCSVAHWIGMTKAASSSDADILCRRIASHGVSFVEPQKQGHTALHKAATRLNRHIIEWLAKPAARGGAGLSCEDRIRAAQPDACGHIPSDIWSNVGGCKEFANWMRNELKW